MNHTDTVTTARDWRTAWRAQAQARPLVTLGLAAATLAVLWLLGSGLYQGLTGVERDYIRYAFAGGMAGFAAGMMLAASAFSLILPGLDAARGLVGDGPMAAAVVVLGLALGVLLMLGLDAFTPHEHDSTGPCGPEAERISRVWLFVLAITLHNLPEGMAIGVGFANGDMQVGIPLTSAIAIQDIPEGLAVAMALRATGLSPLRAALVAVASGLMEPLGALVGLGMSSGLALAYPVSLGLAAGAMIFVVSHEVIPETHRNGHQTPATVGLMAGFAVMMFLDTALG
ncbi:ZIP family metal transporter [Bordetella petrii]|uniref:ZIP family metal transporter n=1 Tax=Bordetella petrii TaxID=94624 RepID=UPI001A97A97F|nr:ZIP family metal transporter [Bordetella petrii]MBO1110559.1 ZIP family metal transporter [Bordetella petrii]